MSAETAENNIVHEGEWREAHDVAAMALLGAAERAADVDDGWRERCLIEAAGVRASLAVAEEIKAFRELMARSAT